MSLQPNCHSVVNCVDIRGQPKISPDSDNAPSIGDRAAVLPGGAAKSSLCRRIPVKAAGLTAGRRFVSGVCKLAYQIVAIRENEKVSCERMSVLIAIAKARVWASEGWQVVVTDGEGKTLEPADFDRLLAA